MANIKHVATDLTFAIAVAAALGWSASLPGPQVEQLEVDRDIGTSVSTLMATEEILASEEMMANTAVLTGAASNTLAPTTKSTAVRYSKSPLSGKPQLSTLKS